MKKANWLDVTEYMLWAGSGVGSLASIASQQIAFTAAPVSFLLLLNLVNRRRMTDEVQNNTNASIEHLDQRVSENFKTFEQQVRALPSFLDLGSLRKTVLQHNDLAIAQLQQNLSQRTAPLDLHDLGQMQQEISDLRNRYHHLTESVAAVSNSASRLATANRVEGAESAIAQLKTQIEHLQTQLNHLPKTHSPQVPRALQDQINHLNRRLNSLPQPFDATTLRQDVDGLIKAVGDMVSRRDLARLMAEVEKIRQQNQTLEQTVIPMKSVNNILRKQVETLTSWVSFKEENIEPLSRGVKVPEHAVLNEMREMIATLEDRLNHLPNGIDLTQLHSEMQTMVNSHLGTLQQQFSSVQEFTQNLDRQQKDLGAWLNRLPQMLDSSALQSQMKYLTTRLEWTETNLSDLKNQVSTLEGAPDRAQASDPECKLVFNLKAAGSQTDILSGSRALLNEALDKATSRVIVVFPYPDRTILDPDLIAKFESVLDRGCTLDIGWGHLGNLQADQPSRFIRDFKSADKDLLQTILSQLTQLKRRHPDRFRFKVLGTDENFLVCLSADAGDYGILGIHPVAAASVPFPEVAVGLRTTHTDLIQGLIDRFDQPTLQADDGVAYYRRAITRYELGDKQGAIADYSEVIRIDPNHDAAYNNRALIRYELGHKEGAIADFNRALLSNPRNCAAYCNRGLTDRNWVITEARSKITAMRFRLTLPVRSPIYTEV
ncbi:MAG: tetratricopeptide repeat protein [Leptolyngbyaceae cyanobacterium CSU_1_3]|nr:tetratricopeptide repeat protein [Leptolyngbyaceae cyanobacterium CSU_1_3]